MGSSFIPILFFRLLFCFHFLEWESRFTYYLLVSQQKNAVSKLPMKISGYFFDYRWKELIFDKLHWLIQLSKFSFLQILVVFTFFSSLSLYTRPIGINLERKVLQNFEGEYKIEKIITKGMGDEVPEVSVTKLLTSPYLNSESALLFRFTEDSRYVPLQYNFETPLEWENYVTKLEFHIYSNLSGVEFRIFLEDTNSTIHEVIVSRIDFIGWKKIDLRLEKLSQTDFFPGENRKVKILSFLFIPPRESRAGREILLVLDDIICYGLPRYKVLPGR